MKRLWWLIVLITVLVILDQVTKVMVDTNFYLGESKSIIGDFFNLTYVRNTGAFWGFGQGLGETNRKIFMLAIPVCVVFYVINLFVKSLKDFFIESLAYALVIAGAIGNLIDRFSLGYVVDFFDFGIGSTRWAVFNVADICVSIAMCILVCLELYKLKKKA